MKKLTCPFSSAVLEYPDAEKSKGTVIVIPGGAYTWKSPREAWPVAERFSAYGYTGTVLEYTVGENLGLLPVREASWAVETCRSFLPDRPVILCGFSAGGHLAAMLGVHFRDLKLLPPDAMILCYPVITGGPFAHRESFIHLGPEPKPGYFSLEEQVTPETPPAFLWHTATDRDVPVQNSLLFAGSLARSGVPFELHIYHEGEHGLSLATEEVAEPEKNRFSDPHVATWMQLCIQWLDAIFGKKQYRNTSVTVFKQ